MLTYNDLKQLSMYDQIAKMNALFGRKFGDAEIGTREAINQHSYTLSEFNELKEALKSGHISEEVRDAIADIFTTGIGSLWRAGDLQSFTINIFDQQLIEPVESLYSENAKKIIDEIDVTFNDIKSVLHDNASKDKVEFSNKSFIFLLEYALGELYQLSVCCGINVHQDLTAVTFSNLSKLCFGEEKLKATYEKYAGMDLYHKEVDKDVYAIYTKIAQTNVLNGEFIAANKFLKSVDYTEPFFKPLNTVSATEYINHGAIDRVQATEKVEFVNPDGSPL